MIEGADIPPCCVVYQVYLHMSGPKPGLVSKDLVCFSICRTARTPVLCVSAQTPDDIKQEIGFATHHLRLAGQGDFAVIEFEPLVIPAAIANIVASIDFANMNNNGDEVIPSY